MSSKPPVIGTPQTRAKRRAAADALDWKCAGCGYSMIGHALGSICPECGLDHRYIGRYLDAHPIIRREEKLLRKAELHRRNRNAAMLLWIFSIFGVVMTVGVSQSITIIPQARSQVENNFMFMIILITTNTLIWGFITLYFHARLRHVESILHYRTMIDSLYKQLGPEARGRTDDV